MTTWVSLAMYVSFGLLVVLLFKSFVTANNLTWMPKFVPGFFLKHMKGLTLSVHLYQPNLITVIC